jgi:DNA-binding transcriptional LysR family regulator
VEIQQLQHFLEAARFGNVGRAAEELHLTQSGLSRSIAALEAVLGLPLFDRHPRGVTLTKFGASLLPRARLILNEHNRALAELQALKMLRSGTINIGMHRVFAEYLGGQLISEFSQDYPDVDVRVEAGSDPDLSLALVEGRLDFVFTMFSEGFRLPELVYEDGFTMDSSVYARREHPLSRCRAITPDQLAASDWVLGGAGKLRQAFMTYFDGKGLAPPRRIMLCESISLLATIALEQDVLTILPDLMAPAMPKTNLLVRLDAEAPAARTRGGLMHRKDVLKSEAADVLMARCRDLAALLERKRTVMV